MLQLSNAAQDMLWLVNPDAIESITPRVIGETNESLVFLRDHPDNYIRVDQPPAQIARLRQASIRHRGDLTVAYVYISNERVTLAA